jgi:hypothetical protein
MLEQLAVGEVNIAESRAVVCECCGKRDSVISGDVIKA